MRFGRDGIAGLVGLAVSLTLLPLCFGLPKLPIVPIGPGFYPAIVLAFMAAMSGLLVAQDIAARRRAAVATAGEPAAGTGRAYGLVAAAFAVVTAYVVLLPYLGFRIGTALFVAVFQAVIERPATAYKWATLAAIAVATSLITFLVFDIYLSVLLPRGRWTNW